MEPCRFLRLVSTGPGIRFFVLPAILIVLILEFPSLQAQSLEDDFTNPCLSFTTCRECIQASPQCNWCGAEDYSMDLPRCDMYDNLAKSCRNSEIVNPQSKFTVIRDDPWRSGGAGQPPVQVRPQEVEFVLRPNEAKSFKLSFQQQENYPVDLYFLLDLSYGMHRQGEARERLIALGNDMPFILKNITNNFRLGFGTFVDKLLMPFTAWTDAMLQDRCPYKGKACQYPHDFTNRLSVGLNQSSFGESMTVALESVSQSLDDAEGGLDGLIQALSCDLIGWRDVSRRIVVYSSNSLFHLAGDGKLGGATKQNTLECLLDDDGAYVGDKIYDYPSVSQVAQKIRDKNANVIFAVMSSVAKHYRTLESFLDGAVVGELEDDSKNIVSLIRDKYYEIKSRIEFQAANSAKVDVKFRSKCRDGVMKETAACENIEIMESVDFNVTVIVDNDVCLGQSGLVSKDLLLNAIGLNEVVVVKLKIHCSCDCEDESRDPSASAKCTSGNGTLECGICSCNPGRFGRQCECDEREISMAKSVEQCRATNDSLICSGNGECTCECRCFPVSEHSTARFIGPYCECNNYNCPVDQNKLMCGGPSRGSCACGTCLCLSGWSGDRCHCSTDTAPCLAANGDVCNGVGACKCGRCVCDSTSGMLGPKCEDCLTCPSQCNEYVDCALCKGFQSGSYGADECELNCKQYKLRKEPTLSSGEGVRLCESTDTDSCTIFFSYEYDTDNDVVVTIQETKACPKNVNVAAIVGGTMAGVLFIPLLLILLFIFLRNRKDKREYAKFLKEKTNARWDTGANPIYRNATTTFTNFNYKADNPDGPPAASPQT